MTTFRILDQRPVYLDLAGNLANGGSLKFYDTGTTTPKDVYADPAKTVNNGATVAIGSDGRAAVDIWGDGAYRVRLYDADGTLVSEADDVEVSGGTGTAIPALVSGKFLTNDGAVMSWADVQQLPDPTGSADKVLSTDGVNFIWVAKPSNGQSADVTVGGSLVSIGGGTGDKFTVQSGADQAIASGTHVTTKAVTFATPFKTLMGVMLTPTSTNITSSGFNPIASLAASNTSGFTAQFDINEATGGFNIVNPVNFQWIAFGTLAP